MSQLNLAIAGCAGRLGRDILRLALEAEDVCLVAGLVRPASNAEHKDVGLLAGLGPAGLQTTTRLELPTDVIIDVSSPEAVAERAEAASAGGSALVIGVTGLNEPQSAATIRAAERVPVLRAENFSLGVTLLAELVKKAAAALGPDGWDAEISETHHRHKKDAPSGTALMLGRAMKSAGGRDMLQDADRSGARPQGAIGFAVSRGGEVASEHEAGFFGPGESVRLAHRAQDRDVFACGALAAARWIRGREPGLYSMADALDLRCKN